MKTTYFYLDNGTGVVPHRHAALAEARILEVPPWLHLPFIPLRLREMGAYDSQEEANEAADLFHGSGAADTELNP